MAICANSTTAPVVQRGLLPPTPFAFRPAPPVDDPRSADELLDEIRRTIEGQLACHGDTSGLLPESVELLGSGDVKSATMTDLAPNYPDIVGVVEDRPDEIRLNAARTIHLRRQLAQAAENGAALLAAFGLPRLVDADFVPLDRAAISDALDHAIATLDAVDGETDLEADEDDEDGHDREQDTADAELSCGWTAKISQIHLGAAQDDHETTALERHGKGFIRCGADDAEDDDRETVNEDGSDWGEAHTPWWDRIGYPEMEVGTHV